MLLALGGILPFLQFTPTNAATGPSTVGTTTNPYGLGYSSDDYSCGANGRFWVFFNDGTSWGWKTSTDGQSWSAESTFTSSVPPPPFGTNDMVFLCSGNNVFYAGGMHNTDAHFYYNTGALNADGTITWSGSETSVATTGYLVGYTSIAIDSNGHVWVALQSQNTGGGGPYYNEVWEYNSGWSQSTAFTFSSLVPTPQIIALTGGKMELIYGTGHISIGSETLSGSTWTAGPSTSATDYLPQFSTAVAIGDTLEYCTTDGTDVYYLTLPYGGSWNLVSTISGAFACSATTDGSAVLGLFYVTSATTVDYAQSNNGGASFASPVVVSTAESNVQWIGASLAVSTNPAEQAMAVWISGSASPYSIRFANIATAPVVNEVVTISNANPAPAASATVTGCHATVSSIPIDGLPHSFGADPSCSLTITVPPDGTFTRFRFPGNANSWTFTTGTTSPDAHSNVAYYQDSVSAYYTLASGCGSAPAPLLTSTQAGLPYTPTLTTTPTTYWLDASAPWSVPAALTSGTTVCSTAPSSGTISGPTTFDFVYSPPVTTTSVSTTTITTTVTTTSTSTVTSPTTTTVTSTTAAVTSTQTVTSTTTVASTTVTQTSTATLPASTSTTTETQTATSTTTLSASTVTTVSTVTSVSTATVTDTSTQATTIYSTTTSTVAPTTTTTTTTATSTVTQPPTTVTTTATTTVTATTASGGGVPTSSSLTCDQSQPQVNHKVHCTDTVYAADEGLALGSVTWSPTVGFANLSCNKQNGNGNNGELQCQADYTPTVSGPQTLTASYANDPYHSSSAGTFTIFVGTSSGQATSTSVTCDQAYLQQGQSTNCHAVVTDADGASLTGTVTWSATDGGTFSPSSCTGHGANGQMHCDSKYTPSTEGGQTVTASYSADSNHHSGSSGTFEVYVFGNSNVAQKAAFALTGGSILGVGLSLVAVQSRKGKKRSSK